MKVVFPFHTDIKKLKFGNAPVEEFIEGGIHEDKLEDKRIFYVVQPNCLKETGYRKQFKIGMSNTPNTRLTDYYNHYGKHNSNNKCFLPTCHDWQQRRKRKRRTTKHWALRVWSKIHCWGEGQPLEAC